MNDLRRLNARHQSVPPLPAFTPPFEPPSPNGNMLRLMGVSNDSDGNDVVFPVRSHLHLTLPFPVPQTSMSTSASPSTTGIPDSCNSVDRQEDCGHQGSRRHSETSPLAGQSRRRKQKTLNAPQTKKRRSVPQTQITAYKKKPGSASTSPSTSHADTCVASEAGPSRNTKPTTRESKSLVAHNLNGTQRLGPQSNVHEFGRLDKDLKVVYLSAQLRTEFDKLLNSREATHDRRRLAKKAVESSQIAELQCLAGKFLSPLAARRPVQEFQDALAVELMESRGLSKWYLQFCIGCLELTGDIEDVEASKVDRRARLEYRKLAAFIVAICQGLYEEHGFICLRLLAILAVTNGMCARIKRLPWSELHQTCSMATESVSDIARAQPAFMSATPHKIDPFDFLATRYGITRDAMLLKLIVLIHASDDMELSIAESDGKSPSSGDGASMAGHL